MDLLLNKSKSFEWQVSFSFFILDGNTLSSNMAQISGHIKSSKINPHDQMSKIIVILGSKKYKNNNNSTCQLNPLQNLLLMSIVDTPEKYVSNVDRKIYKRNVGTS